MQLNRRELFVLAGTAALGCAPSAQNGVSPQPLNLPRGPVDVGTIGDYPRDGVYRQFRDSHGFFLIRRGKRLFAQSAVCTHRACKLRVRGDGFLCPCHGSTFTIEGRVTRAPARRDLPRFAVERTSENRLIVHTNRSLPHAQGDVPEAYVQL